MHLIANGARKEADCHWDAKRVCDPRIEEVGIFARMAAKTLHYGR